ncbi:methylated-DNA--[protein]-cysteine S-methyltransferase [Candidatus Woesearchaeota archaeon]|nr:methylated-DNA--[protein]-cysteine S-methyltransferase [Candidatus Woesearchaeota archaeon]
MKKWSKKDIKFLKNNYKFLSYKDISNKLNRSIESIYWKSFDMNLKKGRWNNINRLNKNKIVKMLIEQSDIMGKSPSAREIPIALRSACQRHFGNFNKAKKAANLEIKKSIRRLPKTALKPSKHLAYIVGLILGDGSFRYQKSKHRTSYVIVYATKDKELMDFFLNNFQAWTSYRPEISIVKGGYKKFPRGNYSYFRKAYVTQIGYKEAWVFLKQFKDKPRLCLKFFPKKYQNWILKGLWDAEGCIRVSRKNLRIHFSNTNKDILKLYVNLLENFKFIYSKHKVNNGFNVDILHEYDIVRFVKLIEGITIKRKVNKSILKKLKLYKVNKNSFFERVYNLTRKIPEGRVSTYRDIAHALNSKAYRAVGTALAKNPYAPKVPCHRVVNSDGSVGNYSGKDGKKGKIEILRKEGVGVRNGKINLSRNMFIFILVKC